MQDAASHQGPDLRAYLTGFVLAVILTAIPFALVYFKALPIGPTVAVDIANETKLAFDTEEAVTKADVCEG